MAGFSLLAPSVSDLFASLTPWVSCPTTPSNPDTLLEVGDDSFVSDDISVFPPVASPPSSIIGSDSGGHPFFAQTAPGWFKFLVNFYHDFPCEGHGPKFPLEIVQDEEAKPGLYQVDGNGIWIWSHTEEVWTCHWDLDDETLGELEHVRSGGDRFFQLFDDS